LNINPFDLLKNAQHIQEQIGSFQEKLTEVVVSGSAGGGMVEIDLNGRLEMLAVRIAPEIVGENDVPMLQDLIQAAYNSAQEKVKTAIQSTMGSMASEMGIPNIPMPPGGFPFT
jgi:DNA-binding YbaB/EbfC family protein